MKQTALSRIASLLEVLRAHPALREVRPTVFHLKDRVNDQDFLHFHDEPGGIFADVRLTRGRVHMPVSSNAEQVELLERIDQILSSLDSRIRDREHRGHQRRKRW